MRYFFMVFVGTFLLLSCQTMSEWPKEEVLSSRKEDTDSNRNAGNSTDMMTLADNSAQVWDQNVWIDCEFTLDAWIRGVAQPGDLCTWTGIECSRVSYGTVFCENGRVTVLCAGDENISDKLDEFSAGCEWQKSKFTDTASEKDTLSGSVAAETNDNATQNVAPRFVSLAAASELTCGLLDSGKIQCWGAGSIDNHDYPLADISYNRLLSSSSSLSMCGLHGDGQVYCFGESAPVFPIPFENELLTDGTMGNNFVCVLTAGGEAKCLDKFSAVNLDVPAEGNFRQLSARASDVCGLREDGSVSCWGYGSMDNITPPMGVSFVHLASGGDFTCGLQANGVAMCWRFAADDLPFPQQDEPLAQLVAGGSFACGLRENGTAVCWGKCYPGCDWDDEMADDVNEEFVQLVAGGSHACGLTSDGEVKCWGDNLSGQSMPPTNEPAAQIDVGSVPCVIRENGTVTCLTSVQDAMQTPAAQMRFGPPKENTYRQISVGPNDLGCGVTAEGQIQCWANGVDIEGKLPPANSQMVSVDVSWTCACGLREDGRVQCWGLDTGENSDCPQNQPTDVLFTKISMGIDIACGLKRDGTVDCWGDAMKVKHLTPPAGVTMNDIQVEDELICGLVTDGSIRCWLGTNTHATLSSFHQFVDMDMENSIVCGLDGTGIVTCLSFYPMEVSVVSLDPPMGMRFSAVSVGETICGIRADNSQVACWGRKVRNIWQEGEVDD